MNKQLRDAAGAGDLAGVEAALSAGSDVHADSDDALQLAALNGHLPVVERLIDAGADVRANEGLALRWGARYGYLQVVECLLDAGADVHADDDAALRWAAMAGQAPVVERLLTAGANPESVIDHLRGRVDVDPHTAQWLREVHGQWLARQAATAIEDCAQDCSKSFEPGGLGL